MATVTIKIFDTEQGSIRIEAACPELDNAAPDENVDITTAMIVGAKVMDMLTGFYEPVTSH